MTYQYLDDATTADVAFEAYAESLEELLVAAWDATIQLMVDSPPRLGTGESRRISVENDDPEMLLFDLLGELLYYKDAEGVLLNLHDGALEEIGSLYRFQAVARGARIDPERQDLGVDIKAVTLHQFKVRKIEDGWEARVVLDT